MRASGCRRLLAACALALAASGCVAIPFEAPPGPRSGEGSLSVSPSSIEASAEARFRFVWTPGPSGAVQGGGFRIELPVDPVHPYLGFTPPQTSDRTLRGHVACAAMRGERVLARGVAETDGRQARCLLASGRLRQGDRLVMEYWGLAPRAAGLRPLRVETRFSGGGGGRALEEPVAIRVEPRAARSLHPVLPGSVEPGEPMTLAIAALDEFGNRAGGYRGTVEVELEEARFEHEFTEADDGVALLAGLAVDRPGFARARVTERGAGPPGGMTAWSNPVRVGVDPGGRILWGDLHFHTGTGGAGRSFVEEPGLGGDHRGNLTRQEEAYSYARDVMRLDFAAATEHATSALTPEAWEESLENARRAQDRSRFTALAAFQWADLLVLLPDGDRRIFRSDERATDQPGELAAALRAGAPQGALPVVIALRGGAFPPAGSALEVYSWRNRGSGYEDRPRRFEPARAWEGLEAGRRFSLVAGSDNHWGHPGSDDLTGLEPGSGGLTAVRCRENDRSEILEAIAAGRAWATTGARIYLSAEREPGGVRVAAAGSAPLVRVDLVVVDRSGVREVAGPGLPALDFEGVLALPETRGAAFCYLRAVQEDGEMAWSSLIGLEGDRR